VILALGLIPASSCFAAELPATILKTDSFDRDPGWEGFNNRIIPKSPVIVRQDFGFSPTHFAGAAPGEIGGKIQRSTTMSYYADKISPKTLSDPLEASGSFAVTSTSSGAGIFFGYFNSQQPGGTGRPIGSFGMDFDFEHTGGRLAMRLITGENRSCGTFITPFKPGPLIGRPTPIKNDGTRYHWTMNYDSQAAQGNGQIHFSIKSDSAKPDAYEGKTFSVDVPPGFKKEGTIFDRFGVMNMMKAGGVAAIYFDDLKYDGKSEHFAKDPGWIGWSNRTTFKDFDLTGAHNFGFSPDTTHAGGKPGEIGGSFWRSGTYGYYAEKVGPLTLDNRLEASGKVTLVSGGPDADMAFGWFNSENKEASPTETGNFLGIKVGGPTRVGHYFLPGYTTTKGIRGKLDHGPLLKPAKKYDWSLIYEPSANDGLGEMKATLGGETVILPLKRGQKAEGARFDRFGLFTCTQGGQMVKLYLDDLKYSAARQ
jgi:hypothetical protein